MPTPYYADETVTLYHGDCREVTSWQAADVLVTDPPYGIALDTTSAKHVAPTDGHRAIAGDAEPFDPEHLLGFRRAVIFGGNNFASRLPDSGSWIVWDKTIRNGLEVRIADAELAWTTGVLGRTRTFHHLWSGAFRASERGTKYHPSQKPVALMAWVLELVSRPGDLVADPYAGSGSTLVAAQMIGRAAIGVEVDEAYCEVIAERLSVGQARLEGLV